LLVGLEVLALSFPCKIEAASVKVFGMNCNNGSRIDEPGVEVAEADLVVETAVEVVDAALVGVGKMSGIEMVIPPPTTGIGGRPMTAACETATRPAATDISENNILTMNNASVKKCTRQWNDRKQ
jgi:hypothetical protein